MNGIDWYVLRAVLAAGLSPRALVVEYMDIIGPDSALTVPYSPSFNGWAVDPERAAGRPNPPY